MKRQRLPGHLLVLTCTVLLGAACSGSAGSMGATPGGAQDNGLAQTQVSQGNVPQASAFTVEGLLNQYDLPLEGLPCDKTLCIDAAYGISPVLAEEHASVFVQIGFSSGIDSTTFRRSPLNLAVLVDRSGSMSGSKLDSVKLALARLIDQLGEGDRLSIVEFDDRVDVLVEPTLVADKATLKAAINRITARGATNMADGLRMATQLEQVNAGQPGISDRIMVFTDAVTNTGDTDQSTFVQIAKSNAALGIGMTLFGVGTDLNQELVLAISDVRGGNYFFLKDPTNIATVFDVDFDYLVTPLAYDLTFQLLPAAGFIITDVYGVPSWGTGSTAVGLSIPTVFLSRNHGAVIVRLDPIGRLWPSGACPLAELSMSYTPADGAPRQSQTLVASYSSTAPLAEDTIFYSQRAVRKTVALVNEALAERQACQIYWGASSSRSEAIALLTRTQVFLQSEGSTLEDVDLAAEARNVAKLQSNMQYSSSGYYATGGSSGSYEDEQPMACTLSRAGAGKPSRWLWTALMGTLLVWRWRARAHRRSRSPAAPV
jgi:Ca-activated chloride channel family protein